ncbi:hypothetical protein P171DRAFT_472671 [Karstenula rhodostoma CBS 690.94]|uniref:Carrier domain-containing protein n=1 Tax=Karstenula rhodostoma CBS 690.94 TaxID=1392251 RepID=A0A9P4PII4_9PLEO|nr:hypothetical protein P171DRAFT_472671 [Karstenula rhodostoma CBS 690.94]
MCEQQNQHHPVRDVQGHRVVENAPRSQKKFCSDTEDWCCIPFACYVRDLGGIHPAHGTPAACTVSSHVAAPKPLVTSQYWVDNLTSPIRFFDTLTRPEKVESLPLRLVCGAIADLIEIGPHATLRRPIKDIVSSIRYHSVLERSKAPTLTLRELVGALFSYGHHVSVAASNGQARGIIPPLTNCPPYPFDHSKRHWTESRLSKDYRLRQRLSGYMLGVPASDWNPLQPSWRYWLCTETMPWLANHVVNGVAVCPGAGMVVMALESVKQMAVAKSRVVSGFLVKDAQFISPIPVKEDFQNSSEAVAEVRSIQNVHEKDSASYEVRVFLFTDARVRRSGSSSDWVDEDSRSRMEAKDQVDSAFASCVKPTNSRSFYEFCRESGIQYGPSFRLLSNIAWDSHYYDPSLSPPDADHSQVILGMNTPRDHYARGEPIPLHLKRPLFAHFNVPRSNTKLGFPSLTPSSETNLWQFFQEAHDIQERSAIVVKAIRHKLAHALGKELEDIHTGPSLSDQGVDSLMAMELRNTISYEFNVSVAVFEMMDAADLDQVGILVAKKVQH